MYCSGELQGGFHAKGKLHSITSEPPDRRRTGGGRSLKRGGENRWLQQYLLRHTSHCNSTQRSCSPGMKLDCTWTDTRQPEECSGDHEAQGFRCSALFGLIYLLIKTCYYNWTHKGQPGRSSLWGLKWETGFLTLNDYPLWSVNKERQVGMHRRVIKQWVWKKPLPDGTDY